MLNFPLKKKKSSKPATALVTNRINHEEMNPYSTFFIFLFNCYKPEQEGTKKNTKKPNLNMFKRSENSASTDPSYIQISA